MIVAFRLDSFHISVDRIQIVIELGCVLRVKLANFLDGLFLALFATQLLLQPSDDLRIGDVRASTGRVCFEHTQQPLFHFPAGESMSTSLALTEVNCIG